MVIGLTGIKIIILARNKLQEMRLQNNIFETLEKYIKMVLTH